MTGDFTARTLGRHQVRLGGTRWIATIYKPLDPSRPSAQRSRDGLEAKGY